MPEAAKRKVGRARSRARGSSMVDGTMIVRLRPATRLSVRQLEQFCRDNSELRIEQTAKGELFVEPPALSESSQQNFKLYEPFILWKNKVGGGGGQFFDSSGGFRLPNSAMRAPDVAWVAQARLDQMTKRDWRSFLPLCPDFVVELRSRTDRLPKLQAKMVEYLTNGTRLGWLIDPLEKQVFVYRPDLPVEHLKDPATLSGEPVLAGFTLVLASVW